MTAQLPESLTYKGEQLAMCSEPLLPWLTEMGRDLHFKSPHSACWRGYIGSWEVAEKRLFLVAFSGILEDETPANLGTLFPTNDRVFAEWFTGTVRCPRGRQLAYVHGGYLSKYERDVFLRFEAGVQVDEHEVINDEPENTGDLDDFMSSQSDAKIPRFLRPREKKKGSLHSFKRVIARFFGH